jgi:hypothetical protein
MAPLCKSILPPSESTCYCGLNYHPEFKHEWDESISLMNTYQLDHILVTKFRNLWRQWTSIVRKQRLDQTIIFKSNFNVSYFIQNSNKCLALYQSSDSIMASNNWFHLAICTRTNAFIISFYTDDCWFRSDIY